MQLCNGLRLKNVTVTLGTSPPRNKTKTPLKYQKGERLSVPKVDLLTERLPKGEMKYFHICLTPRSDDRQGPGNKFKLLSVRTY